MALEPKCSALVNLSRHSVNVVGGFPPSVAGKSSREKSFVGSTVGEIPLKINMVGLNQQL